MEKQRVLIVQNLEEISTAMTAGLMVAGFDVATRGDLPGSGEPMDGGGERLVLWGPAPAPSLKPQLEAHKEFFKRAFFLIDRGLSESAIEEVMALPGAVHVIGSQVQPTELVALVRLFFRNRRVPRLGWQPKVIREMKEVELANSDILDSDRVHSLLAMATEGFREQLDEESRLGIASALYEILLNAVEHGNLGIDGEEKERLLSEGIFDQELRKQAGLSPKKVRLFWELSPGRAKFTVEDEGAGFIRALSAFGRGLQSLSGRGLTIARHHFDAVRFNAAGNGVTLIKYFRSGSGS